MKDSSARQGEIQLSAEERQTVVRLREQAKTRPVREGTNPSDLHHMKLSGLDIDFYLWIDEEGESAQYRLRLTGAAEQPALSQVQAIARLFFDTLDFQILPDEYHPGRVRVMGLFFPPPLQDPT